MVSFTAASDQKHQCESQDQDKNSVPRQPASSGGMNRDAGNLL